LALAALLSAFGSLFFLGFLAARGAEHPRTERACHAVSSWSLLGAIVLGIVWLFAEVQFIAGTTSLGTTAAALPVIVRATLFGRASAAQILALVLALALFASTRKARPATALAAVATGLEAWHLHAAAMQAGVSAMLISELLHVLAAGVWLGGLLPLALFVHDAPPEVGDVAARRFSAAATPCVLALAATALWQGRILVGSVSALFGTLYGWVALGKLGLFVALLGFAARHRMKLTPDLSGADPVAAQRALARSIIGETILGLAIVLLAAVIAALPPPADMAMMGG
jgi:putative copper resistance protein D